LKQLSSFYDENRVSSESHDLYMVFNRDFSNSFLRGDINQSMFIDNPRDHSIKQLSNINNYSTFTEMEEDERKFYAEKAVNTTNAKNRIEQLSIGKSPLTIIFSGEVDTPLTVSVKTPDSSFTLISGTKLVNAGNTTLSHHILSERLKALNDTEYYIKKIDLDNLQTNLFISFKELTSIKKRILFILNSSKERVAPIEIPFLKREKERRNLLKGEQKRTIKPTLSVLISNQRDLHLCEKTSASIFFQLPSYLKNAYPGFIDLFLKNRKLIPWFPSLLMGEHYTAAVEFLKQVQPGVIVSNNTGIGYEAFKNGIPWIAGPYLNIVNSFSLLCLKEKFNCQGGFISNEINGGQIKRVTPPDNFKLYHSIYHPVLLMTSRQCLLLQVIGCEKRSIDDECIEKCNRSSTITNLNNVPLFIDKTEGNYHSIYGNENFLNSDIVIDMPDRFSSFCIDLRDIKTETVTTGDKARMVDLFGSLTNGNSDAEREIRAMIHPTTNAQYKKGI